MFRRLGSSSGGCEIATPANWSTRRRRWNGARQKEDLKILFCWTLWVWKFGDKTPQVQRSFEELEENRPSGTLRDPPGPSGTLRDPPPLSCLQLVGWFVGIFIHVCRKRWDEHQEVSFTALFVAARGEPATLSCWQPAMESRRMQRHSEDDQKRTRPQKLA